MNILIAEDDRDDFLMLEEAIENILPDFNITHSRDGKDLLQKIDGPAQPNLIFLDLNIPKVNGIECLIKIRQRKELQETPIIIYTTSSNFQDIDLCYKHGCTLYLVKPGRFRDLEEQMRKILLHDKPEEILMKTHERLGLFIQASASMLYRVNADWTEMQLMSGRELPSINDAPGEWLSRMILPEDRSEVLNGIQKAIHDKAVFEMEHRVLLASGAIGWVCSRAVPVLDEEGMIAEWFGVANDITRHKNVELELREECRFLEQLTDGTPDLIYVYDLKEEGFVYVNGRMHEITGITPEYIYSLGSAFFQKKVHPDDYAKYSSYLSQLHTLRDGEVREIEFRLLSVDGYKWFRARDHIFKKSDGFLWQLIGIAQNIDYEKTLQGVLKSEHGNLGMN